MAEGNNDIWISFGPEDNDTLRFAQICGGEGGTTVFKIDEGHTPSVEVEAGLEVQVYFNGKGGFMQQPARVVAVAGESEEPVFGYETTGEAVSAENREMFRVGVSLADYHATVDGVKWKLADVSVLGFAFFADESYEIGDVLDISITVGDETFGGRCRVQSIKETGLGNRYGMLFSDGAGAGTLEDGLRKLTMDAQRTQLRRLSRAG